VKRQRQDISAALSFVRTQPALDPRRLALWGTSMGGGHVIDVAASEPDLGAIIAQVPGIDFVRADARATIEIPTTTVVKLLAAAASDALRGLLGLSPHYVKVFSDTGELAVFTDAAFEA
jgi:dienelactone hydrolase